MIILGLDISSFQLNGCFLVDDNPPVLAAASMGRAKESIDRIDKVGRALREISGMGKMYGPQLLIDELVIEDAYGFSRSNDKLLWAVIGGCITQGRDIWPRARITVLRTLDWRRELGGPDTKDTKPEGHRVVHSWLQGFGLHGSIDAYDEHELDAIGVAAAWKHRLENPA